MAYLKVDGKFYKKTRKRLQLYMKRNGWYLRAIDGDIGPHSWVSIQKMLRSFGRYSRAIDGSPGNYTWDGLATFVAYDFSGINYMPQWNVGRLYRSWHPELVKGLQNGLNVNYGK